MKSFTLRTFSCQEIESTCHLAWRKGLWLKSKIRFHNSYPYLVIRTLKETGKQFVKSEKVKEILVEFFNDLFSFTARMIKIGVTKFRELYKVCYVWAPEMKFWARDRPYLFYLGIHSVTQNS